MKLKWKLTLSAKLEILKYAAAVILVMVFTYPGLPVDRWFGGYGLRVYPGDSEIEAAGQ